MQITEQESKLSSEQSSNIVVPRIIKELIEQIAVEARSNEFVDSKSGVSARMTISALENLVSGCERGCMKSHEPKTVARVGDLQFCVPAITGKIELVYEGEQEGAIQVANALIRKSIRTVFLKYFKDPNRFKGKNAIKSPYKTIIDWFSNGNQIDLLNSRTEKEWKELLESVPGFDNLTALMNADINLPDTTAREFVLHGLAECSMIGKVLLHQGYIFNDLMGSMLGGNIIDDIED